MAKVEVHPNGASLARATAEHFVDLANRCINEGGLFSVALAGGSTPKAVYARLAGEELDWGSVHIFWGDERCVPPDHPDSNYLMARKALLDHIPIPPENVYRMRGEIPPEQAAAEYEQELRDFFAGSNGHQPSAFSYQPTFDLILLGMGEDGHTASLFPGTSVLEEKERWVVAVPHETPPPPLVSRLSLTLPAINAAAQVTFIVAGGGKAAILKQALSPPSRPILPTQMIQPAHGDLLWLVDQAAAGSGR